MPSPLSKNCQDENFEEEVYLDWEKSGAFNPDNFPASTQKYCNVLPPPNANGELHLGHCSGYTLMDLLGRYHRMKGKKVLLLPGKDHAGIQSQVVYEKKIKAERNLTRQELGREKFYQEIYDFCQDRMVYMRKQEKKLGLSADWGREKFTLDPKIVQIVLETFIKMYQEKDSRGNRMAYQGVRVINWCPRCATALSDFEVEYKQEKAPLYWLKYGPFILATTRPETKLGDTAVAVHPDDPRYQKMVGEKYAIPGVLGEFEIVVVADRSVDPQFGSGAIKVTPGHDFNDYEISLRHNLPIKQIIDEKGLMMENCGPYAGLTTQQARQAIVRDMEKRGLIDHIDQNYVHNLAVCERCKSTIEPIPSKQWFVNVNHPNFSLKEAAKEAVEKEKIKIHPARFKKVMLSWIDNLHDWCISRQIWWGPQIPAWYKNDQIKVQLESPGPGWKQDEDTFDTWFSSGQWAYTTLGYPQGKDFSDFYPSENMIMGRDILSLWAFRMIILGLYRTGQVPFKNLYFTGLVRDEKGQKMSKSKGNGVEPLEMIKRYGTDALRLSLLIGSSPGNDMNLGEAKISGQRNLVNKLWNISRFILSGKNTHADGLPEKNLTAADRWILEKLKKLSQEVEMDLKNFRVSLAGEKLRDFTWNNLADWYLEVCKFETNQKEKAQCLIFILENLLKLWHPFIPFVTERIWKQLDRKNLLMLSAWPKLKDFPKFPKDQEAGFEKIQEIVSALRNFKAEYGIPPKEKISVTIISEKYSALIKQQATLIERLRTGAKLEKIADRKISPRKSLPIFLKNVEIFVSVKNLLNLPREIQRLEKEINQTQAAKKSLRTRLKNAAFLEKAPAEIVQKEQAKLKTYQELEKKNKKYLKNLQNAL